jgi:tetratricopeptide (TPR) repeat protein
MKNLLCAVFIFLIGHLLQAQTLYLPDRPVRYESGLEPKCDFQDVKTKKTFKEAIDYMQKNNLNKSFALLHQLISEDKANCDVYFFAGYVRHNQGLYEQAIPYLEKAEELMPSNESALKITLGRCLSSVGKFEQAKLKFFEAYELFPENTKSLLLAAGEAINLGEFEYALELIELSKKNSVYSGESPGVKFLKGEIYVLTENYSDAIAAFEGVTSYLNHDDKFKIYYAYALFQEAKTQSDKKMNKKAKRIYKRIKNKQLIPGKIEEAFAANRL